MSRLMTVRSNCRSGGWVYVTLVTDAYARRILG